MECKHFRERLLSCWRDDVSASERARMEAHLSKCKLCQKELETLSLVEERVTEFLHHKAAEATPSPEAWSNLQARLARRRDYSEPSVQTQSRVLLSVASRLQSLSEGVMAIWKGASLAVGRIQSFFEGGSPMSMKRGLVLVLLAALVVVFGTLAAVPAARAVAQEIIATFAERVSQTTVITIEDGVAVHEEAGAVELAHPLTLAEAQEQIEYRLRLPTYLPAGYVTGTVDISVPGQVLITYRTRPASGQRLESFDLYQMRGAPGQFLGGELVEKVAINGDTALLMRGEATEYDKAGDPSPIVYYVLYWQDDEISLALHSYSLSTREMIQVAESVAPSTQ